MGLEKESNGLVREQGHRRGGQAGVVVEEDKEAV